MIPLDPSPSTRRRYVRNIMRTIESATDDQWQRGMNWYVTANQLASMIADGDTKAGAGVIAALSANKRWSENSKIATRAFASGKATGHVNDAIRKATMIMNGAEPERVLPMRLKTGNFYLCILNPAHPTAVCVDRHANDVAVGRTYGNEDRGLGSHKRYATMTDAYRTAARRLGIAPCQAQAIAWVVHTERIAGTVTRGSEYARNKID